MSARRRRRAREFSKIFLAASGAAAAVLSLFTMAAVWHTGDTSPLAYLIPAVFGELATATGFYYWKAKTENRIKLEKLYGVRLPEEESASDAVPPMPAPGGETNEDEIIKEA